MTRTIAVGILFSVIASLEPTMTMADNAPTPGKQVEQSFTTSEGANVPYLMYVPPNCEMEGDQKWPLVVFLHGRGESHGPLQKVAFWGPPKFAKRGDALPFLLVSPQCPADDFWNSDAQTSHVMELLASIEETFPVDARRIYLTGLSMGGYGSWSLAARHPNKFAAVVPICGGGNPDDAPQLVDIPIWVFHGTEDSVVPYSKSLEMVESIRAAGGENVRLTSLEHFGHNSWSAAYGHPELYSWLLDHTTNP